MSSIRTLKTFLAVAQLGSFAEAGKDLGLTAAAVGLQMRALEEDLGLTLFDRGARRVVISSAGRDALGAVADLIARYQALSGRPQSGALTGTFVMGTLVSALMGEFANVLWALRKDYPQLVVRLFTGQSRAFAQRVEAGELDAAVVTQPPHPLRGALVWTRLYSEPMVLVVPRKAHFDLPATPLRMLRESPFIRFDQDTWTGYLVRQALRQARAKVHNELELNSVEAIIELVRSGFGVSIVPKLANVQWSTDLQLRIVPMPEVTAQRHVGLLERSRHHRMQATAQIKDYFERRTINPAATLK